MKHPEAIQGVSRETEAKLRDYLVLLLKWNLRINLVARAKPDTLWQRHMLDSSQLARLLPQDAGPLVDLGSGAGFPGLVLALLTGRETHLVEADLRKCAFLQEAVRQLGLQNVTVHSHRIEAAQLPKAIALTARALASLPVLLDYAHRFLAPGGVAIFPKGRTAEAELTAATTRWTMHIERFPSSTDPDSTILRLSEIHPVSAQA